MALRISDTLAEISVLRSPVARSCHVGNNTANNWGWLALAGNAYLLQYDHTLYGVDEVCIPWAVIGDYGLVEGYYNHKGEPQLEAVGKHVNTLMQKVDRKYFAHLNYGIFADYNGTDLIAYHYHLAAELSRALNSSEVSTDSNELLALRKLLSEVIRDFFKRKLLHLVFDRWISTSRRGYVTMSKLHNIQYDSMGGVSIYDTNSNVVFRGSFDDLLEMFFEGLRCVTKRLLTGHSLPRINYPWITICFSYLSSAVKEYYFDSSQMMFWHGAGSTSQYYINSDTMRDQFNTLTNLLVAWGYLPSAMHLYMVPTYCCQLFATSAEAVTVLNSLMSLWKDYLLAHRELVMQYTSHLEETTDPLAVSAEFYKTIDVSFLEQLKRVLTEFNAIDANRLPIAHIAGQKHPTYNKYGISQISLLDKNPIFPDGFKELSWGEAEMLIKTLANIVIDQRY